MSKMFVCCCAGDDNATGNIVVIQEESTPSKVAPIRSVEFNVTDEDEDEAVAPRVEEDEGTTQREEEDAEREQREAEEKRKADEEAAATAEVQKRAEEEQEEQRKKEGAPADGLLITFREPGGEKTYTADFKTKPLGMDFDRAAKGARVVKAFCAAKTLGVQEGSQILKIGDTDVENMDVEQMLGVLKERVEPLQPDGLAVVFRDQAGQLKTIVFPTKPLGMDFKVGQKPIRILKVQGAARSLGVQAEWEILSIAGADVEQMEFDKILELLQAKIISLPTKG